MTDPAESLRLLDAAGLRRHLRPLDSAAGVQVMRDGRKLWNFAANDYLGLAHHPAIAAAMIEGIQRYGTGATASRLVCGSQPPHQQLELALACAKQTAAALTFSSGFATALGVIPAIVGKADFIFLDKLSHACLVDGARASGAILRVFPHNDLHKLARLLVSTRCKFAGARILVVTESVFSMDGDLCPLREIIELTEAHGALLLVDEAHGFGVLGESGMGLAEQQQLQGRITFQMGTLSKAAGLAGGYIATSQDWVELITNRARSLIYSTAPPPAIAHAALASLAIIRSAEGEHLRAKLRANIAHLSATGQTPILPVIFGSNTATLAAAAALEEAGYMVPAIRFPTIPRDTARLRISVSAAHPPEVVTRLALALKQVKSSFTAPLGVKARNTIFQ
jgi:8-amino-7-oxononanoate synthase